MNPLLHLGCTLDEVDPPRWPAPGADATRLVRTVHALRHSKLGDLRPGDLRMLVAQQVALHCTLPLAALLLLEEPLLDATFYPGDLLLTAVGAPESDWALVPDLRTRLSSVIAALPDAGIAELPRGSAEELARFSGRSATQP
ncbi:contact-dependent growth inhibition system immunity protein [Streptomyces sp. NBC_00687]|uniref:contact-dependent growth inhibition system immunity protein n=1 Tax=Streptomyces sp. NBC_00687 TaxID=2975807 RepID=UPI0022528DF1|nr:contact-dependent growth inhibition system immunity protein [Streptomyces sp. NBC_00687]MCX4919165.1 contact-dependent growth inhibition system immunity protein [Streptomyces sp. NBC_00687]